MHDPTFVQKIAAAWLAASHFSDERAETSKDNRNDFEFWDHRADRYEAQANAVQELVPAGDYVPLAPL